MRDSRRVVGLWLCGILPVVPGVGHAAVPTSYRLGVEIETVDEVAGRRLDSTVLASQVGTVIYQVGEPDGKRRFISASIFSGARVEILPVAGFDRLEIRGINSVGDAAGKSMRGMDDTYQERGMIWTPAGGSVAAGGLDPGSSFLQAVNLSRTGLGSSYDPDIFGNRTVRWSDGGGTPLVEPVDVPDGADYIEPIGISDAGDSLVYVVDGGLGGAGVWNGVETRRIGPAPDPNRTIWPANCRINPRGDVAILARNVVTWRDQVFYVAAGSRSGFQEFTSGRILENVYGLKLNNRGQIVYETSDQTVEFIDPVFGIQRSFPGYRSQINDGGELVFGQEGRLMFWDSNTPWVEPRAVPMEVPASAQPPVPSAIDNAGNVIAIFRSKSGTTETLASFSAIRAGPRDSIEVRPVKKVRRIAQNRRVNVRTVGIRRNPDAPGAEGRVRFQAKGRIPPGLRFDRGSARLNGTVSRSGNFRFRVFAVYRVAGARVRSQPAVVRVRVR